MKSKKNRDSTKIANHYYTPDDYKKNDELSSALAITHEQVSDAYTEGEINGVIDDVEGEDIPLNRNSEK